MSENDKKNIISFDADTKKDNLLEKNKDKEKDKDKEKNIDKDIIPNNKDADNNSIPILNINNNNIEPPKESSFKQKFKKIFLNIEKKKTKRKKSDDDDYNIKLTNDDFQNIINDNNSETNSVVSDFDEAEIIKTNEIDKFRTTIKKIIYKKKSMDWNEFLKSYEKKIKENLSIKYKMKNIFNINSDFMVIWKLTFSLFNIVFVFIFFLKYILMDLSTRDDNNEKETSKRILFLYHMINLMFLFELILSILTIIFNGGSFLTYLKLPLKIYNVIPFQLKKKNIFLLIPKFFRIDIFEKFFSILESFINTNIAHYVQNYYSKIFITYTNDMFKYLLVFGFYAHCLCSLLCYFFQQNKKDELDYVSGLYYTIQTLTTIGFGEITPINKNSLSIMILSLFLGINFMAVITCNIRYLANKMRDFSRETSLNEQFEFLIFQIQKSTGKVFPSRLKKLMSLFLVFRRGLAYSEIKNNNKRLIDICRNKIVNEIHNQLFNYLKENFYVYFEDCEDEFIFKIFECMKPKMFTANKTIIGYNKKVKNLYFLNIGSVFIYNKYDQPVYAILENNIFGEFEFISNTKSNYSVKTNPRMTAYGFVLNKSDWDQISKKYVISTKKFIETIKLRNKKHNEWILNSLKNNNFKKVSIDKIDKNINNIDSKNINENIDSSDIIGPINDTNSLRNEDNKNKIIKKNLITAAKAKNEKYDINNQEIFLKIYNIMRDIQDFENDLLSFKKDILNNMKLKKF